MAQELIISVSGLRGLVGQTLTPQVVQRYISAFAEYLKATMGQETGCVLISYDGRQSGLEIVTEAVRALAAAGLTGVDLGVAATPTTGFLTAHAEEVLQKLGVTGPLLGGIQITASHNPHPWNGIKLFTTAGRVIPGAEGAKVKARYEQLADLPETRPAEARKAEVTLQHAHIDAVLQTVDVEAIRARHFRVLLDSNHGSGSVLGRELLERLGCEMTFGTENETPDGQFAHTPEPTEENLREICKKIPAFRADIGFCQDPDADRLAVIDGTGHYIGEEYTVALCAEAILSEFPERKADGCVVTNCSTSLMTHDVAERFGFPFFFSNVGEANVIDKMLANRALFGGEGNGGPIDPRVGLVRDSFVGMAQILHLMAKTGKDVAELTELFSKYEIVKRKYSVSPEILPQRYAEIKARCADAEISEQDGLRLAWPGAWVLVRPSNTEPVVRVIAEAETVLQAERLIDQMGF